MFAQIVLVLLAGLIGIHAAPSPQSSSSHADWSCTDDGTGYWLSGQQMPCWTGGKCNPSSGGGADICVAGAVGAVDAAGSGCGAPTTTQAVTDATTTADSPAATDSAGATDPTTTGTGTAAASTETSTVRASDDGFKYVAYWSVWAGAADGNFFPTDDQLSGVTHLVLSFADMVTMASGTYSFVTSSNQVFDKTLVDKIRATHPSVNVMASFGGWNLDLPFRPAAMTDESRATFAKGVKGFVDAFGLDGVDIDWEYPVGNGQSYKITEGADARSGEDKDEAGRFVQLLQAIRDAIGKDKILTLAVPAKHGDALAYTSETVPQIDKIVNWWHLMSYDYINRRDTKTGFHSGGIVVKDNLDFYNGLGVDKKRLIMGVPMYAKWFILDPATECSAKPPVGCPMPAYEYEDGGDNGQSGAWTFNEEYHPAENKTVAASWTSAPTDGSADYEDAMSSAWFDETNHIFWTWVSEAMITKTCDAYKSESGGVAYWSLNQDTDGAKGGAHIKAIADCVAGA